MPFKRKADRNILLKSDLEAYKLKEIKKGMSIRSLFLLSIESIIEIWFMKKYLFYIPLIIFLGVAVLLGFRLGQKHHGDVIEDGMLGQPLPALSLPLWPLENGKKREMVQWKGQLSIINLFASWCVPCKAEMPILHDIAKRYGVPIYGIAWKDQSENLNQFLSSSGNPYREILFDDVGQSLIALAASGVPETLVINAHGLVILRIRGALQEGDLDSLLRNK
jgi:cytochrome c biogenesis protein CcmG/thiol:disulfide interchange protein DsbE